MQIDITSPPSALTAADDRAAGPRCRRTANQAIWDSPFLSPGWALAAERFQPRRSEDVRICVAAREAGEERSGIHAPLRVAGAVAMPAGAPMNDYQALVAEPDLDIDPRRLVDALKVQRLDFSQMLADQAAFAPHIRGTCTAYVLDLPEGYAAYAEARRAAGSGIVKDLDKRRRKVEREVGPVRFTAFDTSASAFDQLIAWKRAQYRATGQTDVFAAAWTLDLLRGVLAAEYEQSSAAGFGAGLFTLHIGDQLAAAQVNLLGRRTIHAWIIAHDAAFERYSPGLLLFQDMLKWMDATPYSALDLGAGDYRFKLQLANQHRTVSHGFVGRPSPAVLLRGAQYGVRAAAERLPLGAVSQLPAKAMRRLDLWRGLR